MCEYVPFFVPYEYACLFGSVMSHMCVHIEMYYQHLHALARDALSTAQTSPVERTQHGRSVGSGTSERPNAIHKLRGKAGTVVGS